VHAVRGEGCAVEETESTEKVIRVRLVSVSVANNTLDFRQAVYGMSLPCEMLNPGACVDDAPIVHHGPASIKVHVGGTGH
jgi:hypothetical protein